MSKYRQEFVDEVDRQLEHNEIRRDYLKFKIENLMQDDSAQNRGKANMELDAMEAKIDELKNFKEWLA